METSESIKAIVPALIKVQAEMSNAVKGNTNPFFKSRYADVNSIREACMPTLNKHKIAVFQPTVHVNGKNFVQTILIHESGEWMAGLTEILFSKINDAQAQGSGITYARRYGMQSFLNIGTEDDDGAGASVPVKVDAKFIEQSLEEVKHCNSVSDIVTIWNKYKVIQDNKTFSDAMKAQKKILSEKIEVI